MSDFLFKAYGLARYPNEADIHPCEDVSIVANPATLRELARFLIDCADSMERLDPAKADGWHMHLRDHMDEWREDMVDLIVCT